MVSEIEDILAAGFTPTTDADWETLDFIARRVFQPTNPINEDRLFVGRIPQINSLIDVIYQPGAHAILYGERGVGKTSLANIINERVMGPLKFTKVLKVSCNAASLFAAIWSNVFFDFAWEGKQVGDVIRSHPDPFTVWKIAESLPEKRYLVILDEFDRIQDENTKILTADTIKYFSDNPLKFTILIVGVGSSVEELFGNHPSIRRCIVEIPMPRMAPTELSQILDERLPLLRMKTSGNVVERMVQFSQRLPTYIHLLGQLCAQRAISRRSLEITDDDLDFAVSHALERAPESTRQDYYKAVQSTKPDNRYKEVLLACAMADKNERGEFSASDVCEPYSEIMGKDMGIQHFARHLDAFCSGDRGPTLVKSGKRKRFTYHFMNPVLEPLVLMMNRKPFSGN